MTTLNLTALSDREVTRLAQSFAARLERWQKDRPSTYTNHPQYPKQVTLLSIYVEECAARGLTAFEPARLTA